MTADRPVLPLGVKSRSAGRTLTGREVDLLIELTTGWGTGTAPPAGPDTLREVDEAIVAAVVASLAAGTAAHRRLVDDHDVRTVAALGLEATFHQTVRVGDTLVAETWLESVRPSTSRPGRFVLTVRDEGYNQQGELVVELLRPLMVEIG